MRMDGMVSHLIIDVVKLQLKLLPKSDITHLAVQSFNMDTIHNAIILIDTSKVLNGKTCLVIYFLNNILKFK